MQELLHALLRIEFDDIRPEEWTSSYAGNSGRINFLLKKQRIVIAVKKTRAGVADKEIVLAASSCSFVLRVLVIGVASKLDFCTFWKVA